MERAVHDLRCAGGIDARKAGEAALAQLQVIRVQSPRLRGPRLAQRVDPHVIDPRWRHWCEQGHEQGEEVRRELRVTLPDELHVEARQLLRLRFEELAVRPARHQRQAALLQVQVVEELRDAPVADRVVEGPQLVEDMSAPDVRGHQRDGGFEADQRLATNEHARQLSSLRCGRHPGRVLRESPKRPRVHAF